jgi:hypothetical protein
MVLQLCFKTNLFQNIVVVFLKIININHLVMEFRSIRGDMAWKNICFVELLQRLKCRLSPSQKRVK